MIDFLYHLYLSREEFSKYAKKAVDKLTRSIVQTSSALQESKWLAGAELIYDVVKSKRSSQGQSTKPFMEWVGIQQEVDRLYAGILICQGFDLGS